MENIKKTYYMYKLMDKCSIQEGDQPEKEVTCDQIREFALRTLTEGKQGQINITTTATKEKKVDDLQPLIRITEMEDELYHTVQTLKKLFDHAPIDTDQIQKTEQRIHNLSNQYDKLKNELFRTYPASNFPDPLKELFSDSSKLIRIAKSKDLEPIPVPNQGLVVTTEDVEPEKTWTQTVTWHQENPSDQNKMTVTNSIKKEYFSGANAEITDTYTMNTTERNIQDLVNKFSYF